jgi:hypothetical protein
MIGRLAIAAVALAAVATTVLAYARRRWEAATAELRQRLLARSARPAHWVEVGRAYQRFALLAASLGIRNAFVNQPVEVPSLREQFAQWLGLEETRPDLVVRFGRGPLMPPSLRRPVDAVIGGPRALRAGLGALPCSAAG